MAVPAARMARPAGFEPATTRLEGECSIQLSYGRLQEVGYTVWAGPSKPPLWIMWAALKSQVEPPGLRAEGA